MIADIVISTRNNLSCKGFSLQYVIRSLLQQAANEINIILADNGSEDNTSTKLKELFGQKIGIIDTSNMRGNISASRNAAAACGSSETIFFIDDDMIPGTKNTIEHCLDISSDVDFACGAIRKWAPITWPNLIRHDDPIIKIISTLEHTSVEPSSINRVSGQNIIDHRSYLANFGVIKRSVFNKVGGYDEGFVGWGFQDTELMWRLCLAGYEYDLLSKHNIVVFHLAHAVNKEEKYEENRKRFSDKQINEGKIFKVNHFFEMYDNDGYSLFSDLPDDKYV